MKHSLFLLAALGTLAACADEPPTEVVAAASSVDLTICHNGHTISIGQAAWPAHQAHGDTRGACGTGCPVTAGALTVVDFRADVGVTTVAGGRVSRWHDQSGNGRDAIAATGPTLVTDQMGRSVLRFDGDGAMLIAPPYVPASGTLFIVYGGRNGVQASGRPMGWGDSAVGGHGIDILAIPGFGVDAIFRANFEAGDLASTPNASTMEVDTLSWGVAGLLFERRFADGTRMSCSPGASGCISSSALTTVSDGGFALHVGSSGDGGDSFNGDLAQLFVSNKQLSACERSANVDALADRWLRIPPPPVCGDGVAAGTEQCDDGNTINGDGCSSTCVIESPPPPVCGDGVIAGAEQCDDGNAIDGDGCSSTCVIEITTGCFSSSNYDAGPFPKQVAIGDLNGDGVPDLAAAISNGQHVAVMLGNGNGAFQQAVPYGASSGGGPYGVAIGDLNGDTKRDLVAVGINGASVLLGNGNGSFQTAVDYQAGIGAFSVAIGDLDGDAHPDLVVANQGGGTISVLRGNGDGTFQTLHDYAVPPLPSSVALADLNADGKLDVAVAAWGLGVSILLGGGDGTLAAPIDYPAGIATFSVAISDLNSDGKLDLAVANHDSGRISVLLGAGDGTFAAAINYAAGGYPFAVAVADMNGDAKPDLVVANFFAIAILRGNGDGTFALPVETAVPGNPMGVTTGDLNGDTRPDLAVANANAGPVSVLLNTGTCH